MAHFAKLDKNNIVIDVIVVSNDIARDETMGIEFLKNWSGGYTYWRQCSYNGNFRGCYPGIGYSYDPVDDIFIAPTAKGGTDGLLVE